MKTVEAIVSEDGVVELLEPLKLDKKHRALVTILDEEQETDFRPSGLAKGLFEVPPDFDAPLPDDILDDFSPR